ncbi:MAG: hypothetical protein DDT38_00115 [Firmicutes bacterium]|nr:hypothetical protein [candidate division NPL-UPA2 bacterium]
MQAILADIRRRLPYPFRHAKLKQITLGESGCLVYRLSAFDSTAVLKVSSRTLMPDYLRLGHPQSDIAEYMFYTRLLPLLETPAPQLLASGAVSDEVNYILLEDVAHRYAIPALDHQWTTVEMLAVVEVYAALHGRAPRALAGCGPLGWLKQDPRQEFEAEEAHTLLGALYENAWTRSTVEQVYLHPRLHHSLNGLPSALAHLPLTLLHNDFYPLNIGLSRSAESQSQALLMDYQLIGLGPGMLDILNIGLLHEQPRFKHLDKEAVLRHYLCHLGTHIGETIELAEFRHDYTWVTILGWADYLPRFVRAMHRHNQGVEPWNAWLQQTLMRAMSDWAQALAG